MVAREKGRPFVAIFSVHGIDEHVSNAVVGDSRAHVVEILYATGAVNNSNTLVKHRCDTPVQLWVDPPKTNSDLGTEILALLYPPSSAGRVVLQQFCNSIATGCCRTIEAVENCSVATNWC